MPNSQGEEERKVGAALCIFSYIFATLHSGESTCKGNKGGFIFFVENTVLGDWYKRRQRNTTTQWTVL